MDDTARVVAAGYDAVADEYASLEQPGAEWPRARRLAAFMHDLPRGAAVLALGCGDGIPVARDLVARGFAVTGIDVSSEQVTGRVTRFRRRPSRRRRRTRSAPVMLMLKYSTGADVQGDAR